MIRIKPISILVVMLVFLPAAWAAPKVNEPADTVVITPGRYDHALRNPLKGFRPFLDKAAQHPYGSLAEWRIGWNRLENQESDGVDKIREVCSREWEKYLPEAHNIKVLPRVVTYSPGNHDTSKIFLWPSDLKRRDWRSDRFKSRMKRLAERLGQVWDQDPRVGFVEMGIIGSWGEGLRDTVGDTPDNREILGKAFSEGFKNKKVLVGAPYEWTGFEFGGYWDSFAHADLEQTMYARYHDYVNTGKRWTRQVFGGECAYNWGNYRIQPGSDPTTTLAQPVHRDYLIDVIRTLHTTYLGWVSAYDTSDAAAREGADLVQQALGYRFILEEARYPRIVAPGGSFRVSFRVRNTGSAPFYYRWPVEVSLLEANTRKVVWKEVFREADIRSWLPGDQWEAKLHRYSEEPRSYLISENFRLPDTLARGRYILALAILDPAGMQPAVRFATGNYFNGGRHPLGLIGVGVKVKNPVLDKRRFDDPGKDRSLGYNLNP